MKLDELLQKHNVPLPADFAERMDLLLSGLRKSPGYLDKLQSFKKAPQRGGLFPDIPIKVEVDETDYLGPQLRWFLNVVTSPYARGMLEVVFMVVFFISYLEKTPVLGGILGASLDVVLAASKTLIKSVQKMIPPTLGLLPIPYSSLVGMVMASIFGMIVWPIIAIICFSRQDFAAAVEAYLRVIPQPVGDLLADNFFEINRMAGRMNQKRIKIVNDITTAFSAIRDSAVALSSEAKKGFDTLIDETKKAAKAIPPLPTMPTQLPVTIPKTIPGMPEPTPPPPPSPEPLPEPTPAPPPSPEPVAPPAPEPVTQAPLKGGFLHHWAQNPKLVWGNNPTLAEAMSDNLSLGETMSGGSFRHGLHLIPVKVNKWKATRRSRKRTRSGKRSGTGSRSTTKSGRSKPKSKN